MPLQSSSVSIDAMSNQTKIWAFILGPILAVIVYYLMPDQFVNASGQTVPFTHAGKACAAVTTLMAVWWFTEAIPIAVTAMIPIVLYPLLEVATPVNTMRHYASGTIFLFLGGFLIAAAHTSAQLVQVAQAEVLGIVHDDRIGIGNVNAVLDDGRGDQHVEFPVDKVHDQPLQLLGGHLAVPHAHAGLGADAGDKPLHGHQVLDAVVDEVDLSAAREFRFDGVADDLLREYVRLGEDRLAVGRRGRNDGQVPRTHQRELQRARNRRGGERQRIDRNAHLGELFLGGDAEFLLLVDDQQPQVAEHDLLAQHLVRADQDVDLPRGEVLADLADLLRGFGAVDVLHPHREIAQTLGALSLIHI